MADLEQGPQGFEATKGVFTKKTNKTNLYFIIGGLGGRVVITIGVIFYILHSIG